MRTNLTPFLAMIGTSEGTVTSPATRDCGYDVIVTGIDGKPEIFTDYSTHPFCGHPPRAPKVINRSGLASTASGRYQLLARYWPIYMLQLRLHDFGHDAQDAIAIQQVKECRALDDVLTGHFTVAVGKCSRIWASLPGANYPGQHMNDLAALEDIYEQAGGLFA